MGAAALAYVNLFAADIERLCAFYAALFGFAEKAASRSPIYRALDAGGVELGFNAYDAYELLNLADRRAATGTGPTRAYFTIELASGGAVDAVVERIAGLGGRVIKPQYVTYYKAYQAVLEDPEGNVFRANHRLPA
jgi:predicted enzyme related to lactoylglutathione lyase